MQRISLHRVLPWLTRPPALRHWTCITVLPDPTRWAGLQPKGTELKDHTEYYVRFFAEPWVGLGDEAYGLHGPIDMYASIVAAGEAFETLILEDRFAYNHGGKEPHELEERPGDYPMSSEWACIIDMQGMHPGPESTPVNKMLRKIVKRFPKYDLDSDEGIRNAMRDMTSKLAQVTDLEAVSDMMPSEEKDGKGREKEQVSN
ncbi:hypothetical protein EWM64_g3751 [Hericium alpestre]|uniref:Uncharacterized protein n=1 Tax=Hericium alpestre TaxID=135208 RepID=A0A4Z0A233_9AGAM|nr:hypothetical protein EWM64_g3751 [Hericium alpestre]